MPLTIAYSNAALRQARYPDRQSLMRKKAIRQIIKRFKVGSQVLLMDQQPATVIAYNIAEFGRWISSSHPVMVRLANGELAYCRLADLSVDH